MIYIAHRCNIDYPRQYWTENSVEGIKACIKLGLDVEVDVRIIDDDLWLGHDEPTEQMSLGGFVETATHCWFHCKNLEALKYLGSIYGAKAFWHEDDQFTMIKDYIFTRPGGRLTPTSIAVMPEMVDYKPEELAQCYAICTDRWHYYREVVDGCK